MLIGERPGLSSPDSLGAYFTWAPRIGMADSQRNCVSNIRPQGLSVGRRGQQAGVAGGRGAQPGASGVALKDESSDGLLAAP